MKKCFSLLVLLGCCSVMSFAQKNLHQPQQILLKNRPREPRPRQPQTGPKTLQRGYYRQGKYLQRLVYSGHKLDDKWFFEMGDSLLGRDVLVVNCISKAPTNTRSGFLVMQAMRSMKMLFVLEKAQITSSSFATIFLILYMPRILTNPCTNRCRTAIFNPLPGCIRH